MVSRRPSAALTKKARAYAKRWKKGRLAADRKKRAKRTYSSAAGFKKWKARKGRGVDFWGVDTKPGYGVKRRKGKKRGGRRRR